MSENLSTGHCASVVYTVQARAVAIPQTIGNQIITEQWTTLHFQRGERGVPAHHFNVLAAQRGLLSYEAARALMAWTAAEMGHTVMEYRLVRHKFEYDFTDTVIGFGEIVNFWKVEDAEVWLTGEASKAELAP